MKVADEIVRAVCQEYGIDEEQLLESGMRTQAITAARHSAIVRLWEQKFSARWIAGRLRVSLNSVHYHIYPAYREMQKKTQARFHAERKRIRAIARTYQGVA